MEYIKARKRGENRLGGGRRRMGGEGRSYSYRASRRFGLWRRDVARLERPQEQLRESTNRPLIGRCRVNAPLSAGGVGVVRREPRQRGGGGQSWTGRGHGASIEVTGDREEARPLPVCLAFEVSQSSAQAQLENARRSFARCRNELFFLPPPPLLRVILCPCVFELSG